MTLADQLADLLYAHRDLGDEDHVGAGGRPAVTAIQPLSRPITSTTMTRLCDSAVVCSRSIASAAIATAVSKPIVVSVAARSLSIVFGMPTTGSPCSAWSAAAIAERALAADRDDPVEGPTVLEDALDTRRDPARIDAGRPEDRPASRQDARGLSRAQRFEAPLDQPAPTFPNAEGFATVVRGAPSDRADGGVQPGAVPASGQHGDAHSAPAT